MRVIEWTGAVAALLYVAAMVGSAELLRRRSWPTSITRKIVHIGSGMLIWFAPLLFERPWPVLLLALIAALLTLVDNLLQLVPSLHAEHKLNLGTTYFALALIGPVWLFWQQPALMVAAMMPLTWGDGLADLVGRRFGRRHYTVGRHRRSIEGTVAFVVGAFLATAAALQLLPPAIPLQSALLLAAGVAVCCALVEAVSIADLDNLTITATALLLLWVFATPFWQ